jgi:hypothetical protein
MTIGLSIQVILRLFTSRILEAVVLVLLMGGIYEISRLDFLRWYEVHTKFHEDRYNQK